MAFVKSQSNSYKPRSVTLKNKFNNDLVEGLLINEEDIDGNKYYVVRFLNGSVNKFNTEAFSITRSSSR